MSKTYEVERKFLLKRIPDLKYEKIIHIKQYYLESKSGSSDRIRRSEGKNGVKYYRTIKNRKSERASEEIENEITKKEFYDLKKRSHSNISKYRHIIKEGEYKWEIDKFDNIELVMAEIEMISNDDHLTDVVNKINSLSLPQFIIDNFIMEVSDFRPFSNKRLAIPN